MAEDERGVRPYYGPAEPTGNGLLVLSMGMDVVGAQENATCCPSPATGGVGFEFNVRNISYPGIPEVIPLWEMSLKITFTSLVLLIALLGNLTVVFTIWKNRRMWTTTNFYIVNLAVSDLMVTLTSTWVHLADDLSENWILGAFFCKFNTFAQVLSLVSSIFTLTLIACDRFFGIVFAMRAHLTERRARTFIILVWVCSIGISAPLLFYRKQFTRLWADYTEIWCDDIWPVVVEQNSVTNMTVVYSPSRTLYYTFVSLVLYFVPIMVMSLAYSVIIYKLWSHRQPGECISKQHDTSIQVKTKKKVIKMLIIVLSVFALCWLPFQISILYAEYRVDKEFPLPVWYPHFQYFATYTAYANSALNPIIYTCFNDNFRNGFKDVFTCLRRDKSNRRKYFYDAVEMRSSKQSSPSTAFPYTSNGATVL